MKILIKELSGISLQATLAAPYIFILSHKPFSKTFLNQLSRHSSLHLYIFNKTVLVGLSLQDGIFFSILIRLRLVQN
jgi:hypothetical protein